jgi:hypothetical protein
MNVRTQVTLDPEMQRRAQARAAELKISFAEYVRRLLVHDLGEANRRADISAIFDLGHSGSETDIARNKDEMLAEAILDDSSSRRGDTSSPRGDTSFPRGRGKTRAKPGTSRR